MPTESKNTSRSPHELLLEAAESAEVSQRFPDLAPALSEWRTAHHDVWACIQEADALRLTWSDEKNGLVPFLDSHDRTAAALVDALRRTPDPVPKADLKLAAELLDLSVSIKRAVAATLRAVAAAIPAGARK